MIDNIWGDGVNTVEFEESIQHSIRNNKSTLIPYDRNKVISFEKVDDHWEFSNGYFKLKTSPNHGASIYSLEVDKELFFL